MSNKIDKVAELLAAMMAAEDVYGMLETLPIDTEKRPGVPGSVMGSVKGSAIGASDILASMDFGEDGEPLPGNYFLKISIWILYSTFV